MLMYTLFSKAKRTKCTNLINNLENKQMCIFLLYQKSINKFKAITQDHICTQLSF